MAGGWFHCGLCEIDFQDPYAPENNGMLYGQCPECVRTIERRAAPDPVERNTEEDRPERSLSAFTCGGEVGR